MSVDYLSWWGRDNWRTVQEREGGLADACEKYGSHGGHLGWCRCSIFILVGIYLHEGETTEERSRRGRGRCMWKVWKPWWPLCLLPWAPIFLSSLQCAPAPAVAEVTVAALNKLHCIALHCIALLHCSARSDSSHSGRLLIACAHAAQIPNTASSASSRFGPQQAQKKRFPKWPPLNYLLHF